jgi:hypothetical protein
MVQYALPVRILPHVGQTDWFRPGGTRPSRGEGAVPPSLPEPFCLARLKNNQDGTVDSAAHPQSLQPGPRLLFSA